MLDGHAGDDGLGLAGHDVDGPGLTGHGHIGMDGDVPPLAGHDVDGVLHKHKWSRWSSHFHEAQ